MGNSRKSPSRKSPSRRRLAGLGGIAAVLVAAAAVSPVVPWHLGYPGLALGIVAALAAVGAIGAPTALRPGRVPGTGSIDALRGLRGWHLVEGVELDGAIVDHVVVAPAAVLAVVAAPQDDLVAASEAAQRVRRLVDAAGASDIPVVPMVWRYAPDGTGRTHRVVEGVHVVDGTNPAAWLHLFREVSFAPGPRLELCAALEARAAEHRALAVGQRVGLVPPPEPAGA